MSKLTESKTMLGLDATTQGGVTIAKKEKPKSIGSIVEEYIAIKSEQPTEDNVVALIQRTVQNTNEYFKTRDQLLKERSSNRGIVGDLADVTKGAADFVASLANWYRPLAQEMTDPLDSLVAKLRELLH